MKDCGLFELFDEFFLKEHLDIQMEYGKMEYD